MIGTALICLIVAATDADTLRAICNGQPQRIRLAGIEANERKGGCHLPVCPPIPHSRAKPIAERLALGKTLTFTVHGRSGKRIVADNRELRCQLVASGAAVEWPMFVRRYRLRSCR